MDFDLLFAGQVQTGTNTRVSMVLTLCSGKGGGDRAFLCLQTKVSCSDKQQLACSIKSVLSRLDVIDERKHNPQVL